MLLLAKRERIQLRTDATRWARLVLRDFPVRDATLTREVAVTSRSVDLPHEDPADRFIAASAIVYEQTLVTADARLLGSGQYWTLPN